MLTHSRTSPHTGPDPGDASDPLNPGSGRASAPYRESLLLADHVELRRDGDAAVLVDHPTKRGLALNDVGAAIAELLCVPTTLTAVCERVVSEFDVDRAEGTQQVQEFVADLRARGLVDAQEVAEAPSPLRRKYLDLMARALVNLIYPEYELRMEYLAEHGVSGDRVADDRTLRDIGSSHATRLAAIVEMKIDGRYEWPIRTASHTMIGIRRLQSLERCAARVFADGVPGDFLEAGVLQGGAAIFLRALQVAYDESERCTWLADSFAGLPAPQHPKDVADGLDLSEPLQPWLSASLETVQGNFRTYDLLSDQVRFLPGWFADVLPTAPVERLAILRVDADLYASTFEALDALYDKVSEGGYVVVDDYYGLEACRVAVDDFRSSRGIEDPLRRVDWTAVLWRKEA